MFEDKYRSYLPNEKQVSHKIKSDELILQKLRDRMDDLAAQVEECQKKVHTVTAEDALIEVLLHIDMINDIIFTHKGCLADDEEELYN